MASVTLKGFPEELLARLKREAADHRRSLNGEVLYRLEQSLSEPEEGGADGIRRYRLPTGDTTAVREPRDPDAKEWLDRVRALRDKINVSTTTAEIIAARDEGRK